MVALFETDMVMYLFMKGMWSLPHGWMPKGHEDRDQERGKSRNSSWLPEHKRHRKEKRCDFNPSLRAENRTLVMLFNCNLHRFL